MPACAYATLVTTDSYLRGVKVLRASLTAQRSTYPLVVMYTDKVSPEVVQEIIHLHNVILVLVENLKPRRDQTTKYAFERFEDTWTKLRVFELTQFETVVFLDADMLCTQNMDELFTKIDPSSDSLVASLACICNPMKLAHYPKWWTPDNCAYTKLENGIPVDPAAPKYFNSGMFVLHPNAATFERLTSRLYKEADLSRFFFSDQCFLNEMFPDFRVVSYGYNALKTLRSAHPRQWKDDDVKNIHYILTKPWNVDPGDPKQRDEFYDLNQLWWNAEAAAEVPAT
ncbi:unnamed protein product [Aphanomyces euteiches]|uniref:Nucleotide-diphospho-sugar transferase n=1 Tax=Aphanomyces euteiches TaxID=100861 RepID=A0A6G0WXA4_9STRA|nr:hypothetical protein Ae201684_010784 [Aphanomyces euteiches]KAH9061496.1 hypothetical protein Ae201684P_020832 [Aphanomyces euteiches]